MRCFVAEFEKLFRRRYVWILLVICLIGCGAALGMMDTGTEGKSDSDIIASLDDTIKRAEDNLSAMTEDELDSYEARYQQKAAEIYRSVRQDLVLTGEKAVGWNLFFQNPWTPIFCCLSLIILVGEIFAAEYTSGFVQIQSVTRKGRGPTAAAKCALIPVVSVLLNVLYQGLTFAVLAVRTGFSSPDIPMQAVPGFILTP